MSRLASRRGVGVILLVALVVLAGCSGAGGGGGVEESLAQESGAADGGAPETEAAEPDVGGSDDALQVRTRQVIMTGEVRLRVDSYDAARRNLTAAARDLNGFVSDSSRRRHETRAGTYVSGSVTLRVPRERFDAMMDRTEQAGTVESSDVRSKDVTDQLVDIEARLRNLRAERDRLRTLYDRANDTEAVLRVQERLSETQERIERLEAKKRALERKVAYSTVRVELREERPEPGPDEIQRWYDAPLVGAFLESVDGVIVVARAAAVLGAYALPYLLAFGAPPLAVGALVVRRWRSGEEDDETGGGDDESPPPDGDDPDGGSSDGDEGAADGTGPEDRADDDAAGPDDRADGSTGADDADGEGRDG